MTLHVEHGWQGFHTPHTPEPLTAIQSEPPLSPLPSYTLWSWPPGHGLGHLAGERWRERSLLIWEAGAESPGSSLGLAVGWGGAEAQAWEGSWQRRHWAISGWYCSTCRVQLENPNRE